MKKTISLLLVAALLLGVMLPSCAAEGAPAEIVTIQLSDSGVAVNDAAAVADPTAAVYVGALPIYYEAGHDSTYGEGTSSDEHTAEEAAAHTVVTITKAGSYRISGKLSKGQIFVDLGENAKTDPTAVVTLLLDGIDITCTVAPAVMFYSVYECSDKTVDTKGVVDTSAAGANVIICDGSVNNVNGSHVARIYKEGTTKKLHKYDAAFYSKMTMNISGGTKGDGVLNIAADNEGLDSELHLTINGGVINIRSQDDGINTNEDYISVTTINGGEINVTGGLGSEGDGVDSNGYLVINGGVLRATAHAAADGGIDADSPILINGGTIYAYGGRNDAASSDSAQPYMELSFASQLREGSKVELKDMDGKTVWSDTVKRPARSVTLSTPELKLGEVYHLYVDGVQQQYSAVGANMGMHGGMGNFGGGRGEFEQTRPPEGFDPTMRGERPNNFDYQGGQRPNGQFVDMPPQEGFDPNAQPPNGFDREDLRGNGRFNFGQSIDLPAGEGSVNFKLEKGALSFSGVTDSTTGGKNAVSFFIQSDLNVSRGKAPTVTAITPSVELAPEDVVITITDDPSENFLAAGTLADGIEGVNDMLPDEDGDYVLTVAVSSSNETYTGVAQMRFTIGALPFTDIQRGDKSYDAVKALYDAGITKGTTDTTFEPDGTFDRAQAVTMLARIAGAEYADSCAFSDVVDDGWSYGYIGWAQSSGIVKGYGGDVFGQYDVLTEMQLVVMIARLNGQEEPEFDSSRDIAITRADAAVMIYENALSK